MARARVPSHFSSKMWSFESKGVSRLSASIGLITWTYGSNGAIRSARLRGLEARLQRVPIPVAEPRWIELRRESLDELEREVDLRIGDHHGSGGRRLGRRLHFVLVHQCREDKAPVERTNRDELLL